MGTVSVTENSPKQADVLALHRNIFLHEQQFPKKAISIGIQTKTPTGSTRMALSLLKRAEDVIPLHLLNDSTLRYACN